MRRRAPQKLRKTFANATYPEVLLRFEDGHEIRVRKGQTKTFDAWSGEMIRVVAVWDPTGEERVLVASRIADEFDDAQPDSRK